MDLCGGILGNHQSYDEAIRVKKLSIRYFGESGATSEVFGQIQALSGILNMARRLDAYQANEYGFGAALRSFPELLPAFHDSRASIMRRLGNPSAAREDIKRAIEIEREPTPYTLSKYARTIAVSRTSDNIALASKIVFESALPMARSQRRSIIYVLKDAAFIAILNREFAVAKTMIAEAEAECLKLGWLHTLAGVKQSKAVLNLMAKN